MFTQSDENVPEWLQRNSSYLTKLLYLILIVKLSNQSRLLWHTFFMNTLKFQMAGNSIFKSAGVDALSVKTHNLNEKQLLHNTQVVF